MSIFETTSIVFGFLLSYFGVEYFRRWCLKRKVVDVPNERSSHTNPTPRGGGLVIVFVTMIFYIGYSQIFASTNWSYVGGAIAISSISWLDDLVSIKSYWRFLVHSLAAMIAVIGIGTLNLNFIGIASSNWLSISITFLWIVWLTNAYNFMDGIDGIAASQAITASIGWALFGYCFGVTDLTFLATILFATNLGFIIHNWSPAKIFLGDVGSAFLGFTFAIFPLLFNKTEGSKQSFIFAVLAVAMFLGDSIFTFCRRVLNGEKFWEAHRSHIYQRLVSKGKSHSKVTIGYAILSTIFVILFFLQFFYFGKW